MKKKKKVLLIIFFMIFLTGFFLFLQIYRHSTPEITELKIFTSVTEDNKPINPIDTFYDKNFDIYFSGRLAHVTKTKIIIELKKDSQNFGNYPRTEEIFTNQYPNNYFSFKLIKEEINAINWPTGDYELKVYPEGDINFIKQTVKFKVVKEENEEITEKEKNRIESWIEENDLNKYGDPKDTDYIGGTPLFNVATGETIDRF